LRTEKEVTIISGLEKSIERQLQTSLDQQILKLKKILDGNPDDLSVLMAYAEANLRKGNRLEAMKAYQKVVKMKPELPEVRIALTKIYISMKHYEDAYNEVARIFKIEEENIEGHILLRQLQRLFEIPGNLNEQLESHLDFKASPGKIKILKTLYELEKRKYSRLIDDYNKQLDEDEGNPVVMYQRKKAQERLEIADQALEDLDSMTGEPEEGEVPAVTEEVEITEEAPVAEVIEPEEEEIPSGEETELVEELSEVETPVEIEEVTEDPEARDTGELEEQVLETEEPVSEEEIVEEAELAQPIAEEIPEIEAEVEAEKPEEKPSEEPPTEELEAEEPIEEISAIPLEELAGIEAVPIEEMVEETVPELTETPEVEEEIEIEEEVKEKPPLSEERLAFYDEIKNETDRVLKALNRTRGVVSSLILDNTGHILNVQSSESFNSEELGSQVLQGVSPLIKWGTDTGEEGRELLYWVLEFKKGLMVLQPLTSEVYLIVLGKRGANFGAVRYSIEKNTGKLLSALSNMPA